MTRVKTSGKETAPSYWRAVDVQDFI